MVVAIRGRRVGVLVAAAGVVSEGGGEMTILAVAFVGVVGWVAVGVLRLDVREARGREPDPLA